MGIADSYVRAAIEQRPPNSEADALFVVARAFDAQLAFIEKVSSVTTPDRHLADAGWGFCDSATDVESRVREELGKPGATGQKAWNAMLKMAHGARSDGKYADFMTRGSKEIERQLYTPKRGVEVSYRNEGAPSE